MDNYYIMEMFSVFSASTAPLPVPGTGCGAVIFSISGYAVCRSNFSFSSLLISIVVEETLQLNEFTCSHSAIISMHGFPHKKINRIET